MTGRTAAAVLWACALMTALLWPSHTLSLVHGMPLDGRAQAVLVGLVVPALLWLHGKPLANPLVRAAIVALLVVKVADSTLLTQQGLCARFSTPAPYSTQVLTIPIDEPAGALRSWDVRADWRSESPTCTAIVDRPYADRSSFPAWFVNFTDFGKPAPPISLDVSGYARMHGESSVKRLDHIHMTLAGDTWRLAPTIDGRDAFSAATLTVSEPRAIDRAATVFSVLELTFVVLLAAAWVASLTFEYRASPALLAWCVVSACVLTAVGVTGRFERFSVLLLAGAVLVPVADAHRHLRGAMLLLGVPWLALIAARSLPQIAHFTTYSNDDWLAYQVAGYRIYMNGFWLEGGSKVFDYQPLYRWITGALHLVFGDSSVGETFWDAGCLLLGGAVAFVLVDRTAGFRWAVAAATATLATFWLGTIWYFVGRGLSEAAAAGWGFIAALLLLRHRRGDVGIAVLAAIFAVLMFYTRLNQLFFAVFLLALMPAFDFRSAAAYLVTFAAGVALFAARTWWYTGVFSILYGTSLKNNDTGLRLTTIGSAEVWGKIWHSLRALVWMNEPPSFDPRAVLVVAGMLLAVAALLQVPKINRLPLSLAVVTVGASISAFLAHTHNYPGRMSIHLVPFAVAMTAIAGAKLAPGHAR